MTSLAVIVVCVVVLAVALWRLRRRPDPTLRAAEDFARGVGEPVALATVVVPLKPAPKPDPDPEPLPERPLWTEVDDVLYEAEVAVQRAAVFCPDCDRVLRPGVAHYCAVYGRRPEETGEPSPGGQS